MKIYMAHFSDYDAHFILGHFTTAEAAKKAMFEPSDELLKKLEDSYGTTYWIRYCDIDEIEVYS